MKKLMTLLVLVAFVGVAFAEPELQCNDGSCGGPQVAVNYKCVEKPQCKAYDLSVVSCNTCAKPACKPCFPCSPCGGYVFVNCCQPCQPCQPCPPEPKTTDNIWFQINKAWARGIDNMVASPAEVSEEAFMGSAAVPIFGFVIGAAEGVFIGTARFLCGLSDCLLFGFAGDKFYETVSLTPVWEEDCWPKLPPIWECEKAECPEK
ncbi:hypothetical protein J6T93_05705 [bacterium]|nr:hypothetical protein [bacterium]